MFVRGEEYERLTLAAARSSTIEFLRSNVIRQWGSSGGTDTFSGAA